MSKTATQDQLAYITREEFERLNKANDQSFDQLQAIRDKDMVGEATTMAQGDNARVADMQKRMKARYGVAAATGQAAQAEGRMRNLADAANVASAGNRAVLQQRDNNFQALGALADQGNAVRSNAMTSLTSAAQLESGREAQYQQARAQHRANKWNAGASLAGAGMTAALLM